MNNVGTYILKKVRTIQISGGHWRAEWGDDSDLQGAAKDDQKKMNLCFYQKLYCLAKNLSRPPSQTHTPVNKIQNQPCRKYCGFYKLLGYQYIYP
jgi:hypothetical protein